MSSINVLLNEEERKVVVNYKKRKGVVVLRQVDDLLFLSGHGPENQITGEPLWTGRVGKDLTLEEGYKAARECGIILIGAIKDYLGDLDRVDYIVKAFGLVNSAEDFFEQPAVMNGFSDVMVEVFEERGYHARSAMGTNYLPNNNIPVEIEIIVKIKE